MPTRATGVADTATGTGVLEVDVVERASVDLTTTLTADPGASGTTLAVTSAAKFPTVNNYKVRVEDEVMLVTAGATTTSWTVTRAQDGTTGVAHAVGIAVAQVVGVQRVEPVDASRQVSYMGRAQTFRIPGRAGTTGQKLAAIHNATGSKVRVRVKHVTVDTVVTVAKAVTVLPPVIRMWKVTVLPTSGTAGTKVPVDSTLSSSASVTVFGDASADGTSSATALTATLPAGTVASQEFASRLITAAGFEMFDRTTFFDGDDEFITLNALEGLVIFCDYVLATQNPITDMWLVGITWEEYSVS